MPYLAKVLSLAFVVAHNAPHAAAATAFPLSHSACTYPFNLSGIQVWGLVSTPTGAASPAACEAACCAEGAACDTWQWCATGTCEAAGCRSGIADPRAQRAPVAGWVSMSAAPAPALPNLATSVLLTDYVASTGARCLDGTPQRYWLQRAAAGSANASKFYIHIMGGGWCDAPVDGEDTACAERAYAFNCYLGSSSPACFTRLPGDEIPGVAYNDTMSFEDIPSVLGARWAGGLIVNDPARNPLSHDWNKVRPRCAR